MIVCELMLRFLLIQITENAKKKVQQDKQQQDKHHLERLEHFGRATLELKTRKYINTHEMWNTHMKCKIKIKLCH